MRKFVKKLALVLAAVTALTAAAGCGRQRVTLEDYPKTVAATLGETKIYLDEANYEAMYNQYTTEMYYTMYGYSLDGVWDSEIGTGTTLGQYTKETVMKTLYQTYALKAKAAELGLTLDEAAQKKVDDRAKSVFEALPASVLEATNITEERIHDFMENNALAMLAYQYAIKDTNREVSDEEAAQRTISYLMIRETEDVDADAAKTQAEDLLNRVKGGEDMKTIADADDSDNVTYVHNSYGKGEYDSVVANYGEELKTGETGSVYEEGNAWYVVTCDAEFDQAATDQEKQTIVKQREADQFAAVYKDWVDSLPSFKVNESVWSNVVFSKTLYEVETAPETSAAETEGAAGETSAAAESSAAGTEAETSAEASSEQ